MAYAGKRDAGGHTMNDEHMIWQAVMLITKERIECACGARALFIILEDEEGDPEKRDKAYSTWCQDCFEEAQKKLI